MSMNGIQTPSEFPYEESVKSVLEMYAEWARKWWDKTLTDPGTYTRAGTFEVEDLPGLCIKVSKTIRRPLITGFQVVPFVIASALPFSKAKGGAKGWIEYMDRTGGLVINNIRFIPKHNLSGTSATGQFLCMVPAELVNERQEQMKVYDFLWIPVKRYELEEMSKFVLTAAVATRCKTYLESNTEKVESIVDRLRNREFDFSGR